MVNIKKIASTFSLALLLASASATANNSADAVSQEAQKSGSALLQSSYKYLGALEKYAFHATVTQSVDVDGSNVVSKTKTEIKVKRPNQFRVDSKSNTIDRSSYLSDGVFTMFDNHEYYTSVKTGGGIDRTLDKINKKLGIVLPLSTLLHSDMAQFIHPKKVQYFGTRNVSGIECNYIAFKQGKTVVHMWIENSDRPLVRAAKIVTNAKNDQGTTDIAVRWDVNQKFSDSVFVFNAPKDASNISVVKSAN
jgi:hypothetical protein